MVRKCVVPGCTSNVEERTFHREMDKHGHAYCPVHNRDSTKCACTSASTLFSQHSFPKCASRRKVWLLLMNLPDDFVILTNHCICSRHFDSDCDHRWTTNKGKMPTLNTQRSDAEVREILDQYVASVIEDQALISLASTFGHPLHAILDDEAMAGMPVLERMTAHDDEEATVRKRIKSELGNDHEFDNRRSVVNSSNGPGRNGIMAAGVTRPNAGGVRILAAGSASTSRMFTNDRRAEVNREIKSEANDDHDYDRNSPATSSYGNDRRGIKATTVGTRSNNFGGVGIRMQPSIQSTSTFRTVLNKQSGESSTDQDDECSPAWMVSVKDEEKS